MIKPTKCILHIDKLNHFDLYVLFIKATKSIMKWIHYRTDFMNRYMKRCVGNIMYEYCDYKGK
ncbi:hypothetical protein C5G87_02070 [Paenibacillus peoriae]|nr:hypothetical protein PPYC1_24355 [Paenibacillus polymyxa]OMF44941.1 hypothetical protein BK135_15755 [Paenibacillus peoriae]PPQ50676.1 hypothetical protein C5G87_02070 [Paenibacillus peoriae]